jgi:hypothetical protein
MKSLSHPRWAAAVVSLAVALVPLALAAAPAPAGAAPRVTVLASHLNQPKKLSFAPNGRLVVALSGDGAAPAACTDGSQPACAGHSGAIDEISAAGTVTTLLGGLSSLSSGRGADAQATGPSQALVTRQGVQVIFQGSLIDPASGRQVYGPAGGQLEKLIRFTGGRQRVQADFGRYEAKHNPDHGAGTVVAFDGGAIDSDPYAIVPYRGGYAVADSGGNDVLFVSRQDKLSVLAVLPTIRERAPAGEFGSRQTTAIEARAQAVPDALAVGPDGALYVGELGGQPYAAGTSDIYRIVPGRRPAVYARGLTAVGDIAFDPQGRLVVLEIDAKGLAEPGFSSGDPASGDIIRIGHNGRRSTLLGTGLLYPTALAVARDGTIYVSDFGASSADIGDGGEILKLTP